MKKEQENKKVIGFDMDGVILDHTQNKIRSAKKLGFSIKKEQTPSEIIRTIIPQSVYEEFKAYMYNDPTGSLKPRLMSGVKNTLNCIAKKNTPYFLISKQKNHRVALNILKHHALWPKYFNNKNTFFVDGSEAKDTKAVELGITHYFDDESRVLEKLVSVKNKFLFDHLDVFKNSPYRRIKSWKEITKLV
jgi:phosphoglycolate phosphatase-like HAD superfamily hydrolase